MSVIGCRIKTARKAKGLTQRDVGTLLGLSHVFISEIERGSRSLPRARRADFAQALGLTVNSLTPLDADTIEIVANRLANYGGCARAVRRLREMTEEARAVSW